MHFFYSFLFCSLLIRAQQSDPLQEYLKATPAQWELLQFQASEFWDKSGAVSRSLGTIQGEISAETLKPTIDPIELGRRYRQIEELCRGIAPARAEVYRLQMQVLNAEQRLLLPALAESTKRLFIGLAAREVLLLPRPERQQFSPLQDGTSFEAPTFYFDPEYGNQKLPQDLVAYLGLTEGQQDQIRHLHLRYRDAFDISYAGMKEAANRIEKEIALDIPSVEKLGSDYAAIETFRREIAGREAALRRDLSSVLSQPQQDLLTALGGVEALWPLSLIADNLFLFAPAEQERPASTAEVRFVSFGTPFSQTGGTSIGNSAADTSFRFCKGISAWIGSFAGRRTTRPGSR